MIFRDSVKHSICFTPDLFIYPSTSASLSCTYILQQDAKTIQEKLQGKGKQYIRTIPLFIKGTWCNTPEHTLGNNPVVTLCDMAEQKEKTSIGRSFPVFQNLQYLRCFRRQNVREARSSRKQEESPSHCSKLRFY